MYEQRKFYFLVVQCARFKIKLRAGTGKSIAYIIICIYVCARRLTEMRDCTRTTHRRHTSATKFHIYFTFFYSPVSCIRRTHASLLSKHMKAKELFQLLRAHEHRTKLLMLVVVFVVVTGLLAGLTSLLRYYIETICAWLFVVIHSFVVRVVVLKTRSIQCNDATTKCHRMTDVEADENNFNWIRV